MNAIRTRRDVPVLLAMVITLGIAVPAALCPTRFWFTPGKISRKRLSMLTVERRSAGS